MNYYKKLSLIIDKLSIAGHMSDDLKDFEDDYARGRFNSALLFLPYKNKRNITKLFTFENEVNFIEEIKIQILKAEEFTKRLKLPPLLKILDNWNKYFINYSKLTEKYKPELEQRSFWG